MSDLISRQGTIDRINEYIEEYSEIDSDGNHSEKWCAMQEAKMIIENMPPAQPEQHEIGYSECANSMLKMWIDNVLTDGEYNRIMDKLNAHWAERREG
jgi:hypothetical protein